MRKAVVLRIALDVATARQSIERPVLEQIRPPGGDLAETIETLMFVFDDLEQQEEISPARESTDYIL